MRDDLLVPIGGICLAAAILLNLITDVGVWVNFLVGILAGMALVLNLVGLFRRRNIASDSG